MRARLASSCLSRPPRPRTTARRSDPAGAGAPTDTAAARCASARRALRPAATHPHARAADSRCGASPKSPCRVARGTAGRSDTASAACLAPRTPAARPSPRRSRCPSSSTPDPRDTRPRIPTARASQRTLARKRCPRRSPIRNTFPAAPISDAISSILSGVLISRVSSSAFAFARHKFSASAACGSGFAALRGTRRRCCHSRAQSPRRPKTSDPDNP